MSSVQNCSSIQAKECSISIFSFNARGMANATKRNTVFNWLKTKHKGVIFLQETHTTSSSESTWQREWPGEVFFCHGTNSSRGVAILFPPGMDIKVSHSLNDSQGRYLLLDTTIDDIPFTLINIYAPTKDYKNK